MTDKRDDIAALVAKWHSDEEVQVIDLSGFGISYETAIWVLVFALLEKITQEENDALFLILEQESITTEEIESLNAFVDETVRQVDGPDEDGNPKLGGLSGAMVGAAKNALRVIVFNGVEALNAEPEEGEEDRRIKIKKADPLELRKTDPEAPTKTLEEMLSDPGVTHVNMSDGPEALTAAILGALSGVDNRDGSEPETIEIAPDDAGSIDDVLGDARG